jgi:predicted transcriptional regulator
MLQSNNYYQNLYRDLQDYRLFLQHYDWHIHNLEKWLKEVEEGREDKKYEQMVRNELRKIKLIKRAIEDEIDLINSILNEAKAEMEEQSN